MEARRRFSFLTPLSNLLILWFVFDPSSAASTAPVRSSAEEKVTLALYYETLCPYCSNFIVNLLPKLFDDGLADIVDIKFIPYGNAKIGPNDTITCQHGPSECLLNTIEACAIHVWPDLKEHFPFIYCVENLIYEGKYPEWETCFEKLNLDPKPVSDCYSSGYGEKLELQYAAVTNALQPRHTYVPWVVVNGQPLYDGYYEFESYICNAYKGTTVPQACSELSLGSIPKETANHIHPVCYAEETKKTTLSRIRSAIASWMHQVNMAASI